MARETSVLRAFLGASYLLVLTMILLWLYFNSEALYGDQAVLWLGFYNRFLISFSLILIVGLVTSPKVLQELGRAEYWKQFGLRFIPSAIVSTVILVFVLGIIKGPSNINPLQAIDYVPIPTLLFHLFVVSNIEEIMFRGILFEGIYSRSSRGATNLSAKRAAYIITALAFAIYHFYAARGSYVVMLTYIPLSFAWTYLKLNGYPFLKNIPRIGQFFQPTRFTQQSNAGSHFAWNLFILGFVAPFRT